MKNTKSQMENTKMSKGINTEASIASISGYKVRISLAAFHKMLLYVHLSTNEVSWLGNVTVDKGAFFISDVFLVEQENDMASTEMTKEGLAKLAQELLDDKENGMERWNTVMLWGHSHVNMSTGASGQDDIQLREFIGAFPGEFFIRLIMNKHGEMNFTLCLPFGVKLENLPYTIWDPIPDGLEEEVRADLEQKVTKTPLQCYNDGYGIYNKMGNRWLNMAEPITYLTKKKDEEDYDNCAVCHLPAHRCESCELVGDL